MKPALHFTDLNYEAHICTDPQEVIRLHQRANAYTVALAEHMQVTLVKHLQCTGQFRKQNRSFYFFRRKNSFAGVPFRTHRFLRREKPDVILIPGFIFPLQLIALRLQCGKHPLILIRHHAEKPFRHPVKRWLQRMACRLADGFLFTSKTDAGPWISQKIIPQAASCFEIHAASSSFQKKEKEVCRQKTGMRRGLNFLWVGRLDANKDPLTVLAAFDTYLTLHSGACLYMIYQTEELLASVTAFIETHERLQSAVHLVGKKENTELEDWFNAADFYINASHHEGGSFALVEAMACGCIPIVSAIPSSLKLTGDGTCGLYFSPGKADELQKALETAATLNRSRFSDRVSRYFAEALSTRCIADRIQEVIEQLQIKKRHQ